MFRILADMKHPKSGNKSFILLGLTLLLGAFLTVIVSNHFQQGQDDFTPCELTENAFDVGSADSDFQDFDLGTTHTGSSIELITHFFTNGVGQVSGNSFVPIFSVSRKILYLQLQLHH